MSTTLLTTRVLTEIAATVSNDGNTPEQLLKALSRRFKVHPPDKFKNFELVFIYVPVGFMNDHAHVLSVELVRKADIRLIEEMFEDVEINLGEITGHDLMHTNWSDSITNKLTKDPIVVDNWGALDIVRIRDPDKIAFFTEHLVNLNDRIFVDCRIVPSVASEARRMKREEEEGPPPGAEDDGQDEDFEPPAEESDGDNSASSEEEEEGEDGGAATYQASDDDDDDSLSLSSTERVVVQQPSPKKRSASSFTGMRIVKKAKPAVVFVE